MRGRALLLGSIIPVAALLVWEGAVSIGVVDGEAMPPPSAVVAAARAEIVDGVLVDVLGHSLLVVLAGWGIAVVVGLVVGIVLGLSHFARLFSDASIEFSRAIPAVALVPVGILIFGFDLRAELFVVAFAAFWPMVVNTTAAVELVPSQLSDVAKTMQLRPLSRVFKVTIPAAMPRAIVGMRLSMATAVILMAVAEMTGNPAGIGNELVLAQTSVRPATAMFYILAIGIVGMVLNTLLLILARKLTPHGLVGDAS